MGPELPGNAIACLPLAARHRTTGAPPTGSAGGRPGDVPDQLSDGAHLPRANPPAGAAGDRTALRQVRPTLPITGITTGQGQDGS